MHLTFIFIPRHRFEKSVENLSGDRYCKHFTAWRQFLTCLYAQITGKDSLREIENGLLANHDRLYHLGMEVVPKSTLSEAMNRRDPEIFKALFEEILDRALKCAPSHKFRFHNPLYAIDSTTIDLCLNLYDWAHYRKNKGAIKLHTELDLSGNLPCFVMLSNGKMADIRAARENIVIVPDSIYTFDKGYYDLNWFQHIADSGAYFVTRLKDNAKIEFLGQHREANENYFRPLCQPIFCGMEFELFFQFQSRFGFKFYLISFHFIHPLSFWGNIAYLFNITLFKRHYTRRK